jgi:periplasmic divalent cation tolerance protein
LIPKVESIYRWQGAVETSTEVVAVLKTERSRYEALEKRLRELHPYEVPECISVRIDKGLPTYLHWLTGSTASA